MHAHQVVAPQGVMQAAEVATVSVARYQEIRTNVFGSSLSLRHFMDRHWTLLMRRGAIVRVDAGWRINPEAFDAQVRILGRNPRQR